MQFTKIRDVKSPERWTWLSSGIDFFIPFDLKSEDVRITPLNDTYAPVDEESIIIPAGKWVLIPSWLKVCMSPWLNPECTYDLVLKGKSWVSIKTNLIVWAAVIDNDYRGEFNIHLINPTSEDIILKKGAKIVQWIIREVQLFDLIEVSNNDYNWMKETERGEGWFGSTWN